MQNALALLQQDLSTVRTGRATPALVDHVEVSVYSGSARMKVMELATVAVTDAQTLTITPFDASILDEMQKGIQEANIGFNPSNDGTVLRINIPLLSEERRRELIGVVKQKLENGRINIRRERQDALKSIKELEGVSEDEVKRLEKELQKLTDDMIGKIDALGDAKEKELLSL
jgi:ribosome recycling factor